MIDARQANAVCARRQTNTRHLRCAEPGPILTLCRLRRGSRPEPRATVTRSGSSRRSPCRRQRLAWVSLSWAKRAGRGPAPRPPRSVPARPICLSRRRGAAVPGPGDASVSRCDRREDCETGRGSHALACVIGVGKILSILQQTHAQQRDRVCNDCEDCTGCRVICGSVWWLCFMRMAQQRCTHTSGPVVLRGGGLAVVAWQLYEGTLRSKRGRSSVAPIIRRRLATGVCCGWGAYGDSSSSSTCTSSSTTSLS